jgi:hypothetical protein
MIYTEGFGAEFIRAEPVFLHVGVSIHSMDQQMPAAYYLQLFAADTAPDKVYAFSTNSTSCGSTACWNGSTLHHAPGE